jgi:hypothetical protein
LTVLPIVLLVPDPSSSTTRNKQGHAEDFNRWPCEIKQSNYISFAGIPHRAHLKLIRKPLFVKAIHRFTLISPSRKYGES